MDKPSRIVLKQFSSGEAAQAFDIYKEYMQTIVNASIGWDDTVQKQGFDARLQAQGFHWVTLNEQSVGMLHLSEKEQSQHLHLLIIFAAFQRRGIAFQATEQLRSLAHARGLALTLNCFKKNKAAIALYTKLKFEVLAQDQHFYHYSSPVPSKN